VVLLAISAANLWQDSNNSGALNAKVDAKLTGYFSKGLQAGSDEKPEVGTRCSL
jgi:hypothetical protein